MIDPEQQELPEGEVEELVARLKTLPRAKAPADFSAKLHARIHQEAAQVYELPVARTSTKTFPYRRIAYGVAAAAVITVVLLKIQPNQTAPNIAATNSASDIVVATPPAQIPPVPEQQMKISAAPEQHPVRGHAARAAVAQNRVANQESDQLQAKPSAARPSISAYMQQQSRQTSGNNSQDESGPLIIGGAFSNATLGNAAPLPGPGLQSGFDAAPSARSSFGLNVMRPSFNSPVQPIIIMNNTRASDSLRKIDSLRNAKHRIKNK